MKRVGFVGCAVALALGLSACGSPGEAKQKETVQLIPPLGQLPELPERYFPAPAEEEVSLPPPGDLPEPLPLSAPSAVTVTEVPPAESGNGPEQPPERVTVVEVPPPPPPPPNDNSHRFSVPIGPGQIHVDIPD